MNRTIKLSLIWSLIGCSLLIAGFLTTTGCLRKKDPEHSNLTMCLYRAKKPEQLEPCYKLACEMAKPCSSRNGFYRQTISKEIALLILDNDPDKARFLAEKHSFNFDTFVRSLFSEAIKDGNPEQAKKIFVLVRESLDFEHRKQIIDRVLSNRQVPCEIYQLYKDYELGLHHEQYGNLARICMESLIDSDIGFFLKNNALLEELAKSEGISVNEQKFLQTIYCYSLLKDKQINEARICVAEYALDKEIIATMLIAADPIVYLQAKLLL